MHLHDKVLNDLRRLNIIKKGTTILIGVSGGVDSMVLAHIMHEIRHELGIRLFIAHFNHRLRKSSSKDQYFVEQFCQAYNIPIILGERNKRSLLKKMSEDQARDLRFKFFIRSMKRSQADILMLAHNQNDLAETVLMRLIRGSGLYGIRGIVKIRNINGMEVVRPLLDHSRNEIELYAKSKNIGYCHDETNDKDIYLRNKVRRNLVPLLAKVYNPSIVLSLAQLAKTAQDDYAFLLEITKQQLKENIVRKPGSVRIKMSFFKDNHVAVIRLGIRCAFEDLTGDLNKITFEHVQAVCDLIATGNEGSMVHWPNDTTIVRLKGCVEFRQ